MKDAASPFDAPPPALEMAEAVLRSWAGVTAINSWRQVRTPEGARWGLLLRLDLTEAQPTEHVPQVSEWVVTVDPSEEVVRVYPNKSAAAVTATFPHQDFNGRVEAEWGTRSGYLCTPTTTHKLARQRAALYDEPAGLYERVLWHVNRAQEWLRDAATGHLTEEGDPFELPDFRTRGPGASALAVYEDAASLATWNQAPRAGLAEVVIVGDPTFGAITVQAWFDRRGKEIFRPSWGLHIAGLEGRKRAAWLRLDAIAVLDPWQAPASGPELLRAARAQGIDPRAELAPLWGKLRGEPDPILLIGAPIPTRFGEPPSAMHWQALRLPTLSEVVNRTAMARNNVDFARALGYNDALAWVPTTENWHPAVLENRGRLNPALRALRVVVAGTGALGSAVAEVLVRMGLHEPVLVDPDRYEAGNGVRHRLTLEEVGRWKAPELAKHLNASNPSARVRGFEERLPPDKAEVVAALAEADLVLDFTASDALLRAVPNFGLRSDALIVSASVGLFAERLFLFADRADRFTADTFDAWFEPYRKQEHKRAEQEGLPQAAGCWHPVTPVPFHRLLVLTGLFVERLERLAEGGAPRVSEIIPFPDVGALRVAA